MRNAQRILALGAMTLTAGAVFAMTATAASAATTQDGKVTVAQGDPDDHQKGKDGPKDDPKWDGKGGKGGNNGKWDGKGGKNHDRSWVVGWYKSKKSCEIHKWWGEHSGQFDWGVCVPAFGSKGWILVGHDNNRRWRD